MLATVTPAPSPALLGRVRAAWTRAPSSHPPRAGQPRLIRPHKGFLVPRRALPRRLMVRAHWPPSGPAHDSTSSRYTQPKGPQAQGLERRMGWHGRAGKWGPQILSSCSLSH